MGSYTPTTWNPGAAPGISAAELNRIETGVDQAHDEINANAAAISSNDGDIADHESRISALESGGPNPHTHDNVTTSTDGFMDNLDKQKLDGIDSGAQVNQNVVAGTGLSGGGSGDTVNLQHDDTSPLGGYYDYTPGGTVFSTLTLDGFGHLTDFGTKTITPSLIGALPTANPDCTGGLRQSGAYLVYHNAGYGQLLGPGGGQVIAGSGVGGTECYLGGVPYLPGAFDLTCDENGSLRRIKYENKASARRFKKGIRYAKDLDPDEVLKWRPRSYIYKSDPNERRRVWFLAEEIFKASGEQYVVRGEDGKLLNTDDRAMIATLIAQVQRQAHQLQDMGARLQSLEGGG